ncbi:bifunctional enoyl-CoA hydratase/phosphate acetyltransferase [Alkalicoccus chagannorensis]|uniref:bifunctional enoyl-CoA hydratase/phosphate acetyltransferase n=1 Tax=Alkalicoccus chagannorensis TaxID=427072 RepID=UPI000419DAA6|nr:bifunctional enoyl-CoA hydratase/phosphate acetyltransferase [Alkalicoccus chagannorensis]
MDMMTLKNKIHTRERRAVIAVAHAVDASIFQAAAQASDENLATFLFIGPLSEMTDAMQEAGYSADTSTSRFIDTKDEKQSASEAVKMVSEGEADVLMKGMTATSTLLKAVLDKEHGLRTGRILSHVAGFSLPGREKLLFLSDAAMNIAPDLEQKVKITTNAVEAVKNMGVEVPKAAVIAAVETVNTSMQATLDAAALTMMNQRGQISGCIIDGPLGFDNAISPEAAEQKGITSPVAGQADLLLVPQIETGNALYKSFTYIGGAVVGGMIVGAGAPIVLSSRSDSVESKLFSMMMAVSTADQSQEGSI